MMDFRSDTVTKPTPEMMAAIATAEVGDAARGDDPTTNRLEAVAAEIAGKEASLFVPSGTMANLAAVLTHTRPGEEVIVEASAHIYNSELGSISAVAGTLLRPIKGEGGILDPAQLKATIKTGTQSNTPPTRLVCLENTMNAAGGVVIPLERMAKLYDVARNAGVPVHLDGARLFNAAVFLNRPIADLCRYADSVMFALSKGLGAPIGSMLLGRRDFIAAARRKAKMLGGGMRQVGIIAAPALVALADPFPNLRHDHALARRLAEGLAAIDESLVRLDTVQTNIANCFIDRVAADPGAFVRALNERGVFMNVYGPRLRFVTHRHIDEGSVDACLSIFKETVDAARQVA